MTESSITFKRSSKTPKSVRIYQTDLGEIGEILKIPTDCGDDVFCLVSFDTILDATDLRLIANVLDALNEEKL